MVTSGGKRLQRVALLALTKPPESTIPKLSDTLTGHTQKVSDLFEGVLTLAIEPEVQAQNLGIPRLEGIKRPADRLGQETALHILLRLSGLFVDEAFHELRVLTVANRGVQSDFGRIEGLKRLDEIRCQIGGCGELLRIRLTPKLLLEALFLTENTRQI